MGRSDKKTRKEREREEREREERVHFLAPEIKTGFDLSSSSSSSSSAAAACRRIMQIVAERGTEREERGKSV